MGLEPKTPVFECAKTVLVSHRKASVVGTHFPARVLMHSVV
jgi:hypothetical protein